MLNLEWFRSFRAVFITKSVSKAAEHLSLSQPTVSQHIQALEARIGHKLFERKSKGVVPTDRGINLSNMVAGAIETLEKVEAAILEQSSSLTNVITIGISRHLYRSIIGDCFKDLGSTVHVTFGDRKTLISEVERGNILYAIVPGEVNTFDIICHHLFDQNLVLVGTNDINLAEYDTLFLKTNKQEAITWLEQRVWYAHNIGGDFIKYYWLNVFNRKRPSIVPDFVVPNEYEILCQLVEGSGLSIANETTVEPFIQAGRLHKSEAIKVNMRNIVLLANKKNTDEKTTRRVTNSVIENNQ
jgi:DNA-binding transcriptional LysR family regulator